MLRAAAEDQWQQQRCAVQSSAVQCLAVFCGRLRCCQFSLLPVSLMHTHSLSLSHAHAHMLQARLVLAPTPTSQRMSWQRTYTQERRTSCGQQRQQRCNAPRARCVFPLCDGEPGLWQARHMLHILAAPRALCCNVAPGPGRCCMLTRTLACTALLRDLLLHCCVSGCCVICCVAAWLAAAAAGRGLGV